MKLILQPPGSNLCGQACVAMIAGISLDQAIETVGTKGATITKQIVSTLQELGFECGDKLKRVSKHQNGFPDLCIIKVLWMDKSWVDRRIAKRNIRSHWLVYYKSRFFDPAGVPSWTQGRITSYLEVRKPKWINL